MNYTIGPVTLATLLQLAFLATAAAANGQTPSARISDEMVTIVGRDHPEQIPDWLAWEQLFRNVKLVHKTDSGLLTRFAMTPADLEVLNAEGLAQATRDNDCLRRQQALEATLQETKASPAEAKDRLREVQIKCRWDILDARDRVLERLSPEGAASVAALLAETRAGVTALVPKDDLPYFRLP